MPEMEEHRASARRPTIKGAKAILSLSTLMDCVIRDQSDGGARLEFEGPIPLPPVFKLRVVSVPAQAIVERAWQRGFSAGVRFKTPLVSP